MYEVDDRDRVEVLPEVPPSDPGATDVRVLANEWTVVVGYRVAAIMAGDEDLYAILRFYGARVHLLGPPNDEALHGHPLWGRGLTFGNAHRVVDSSLIRKLERMNSVHTRHRPSQFDGDVHYILTFHDSTFECVATRMDARVVNGPGLELAAVMVEELRRA